MVLLYKYFKKLKQKHMTKDKKTILAIKKLNELEQDLKAITEPKQWQLIYRQVNSLRQLLYKQLKDL